MTLVAGQTSDGPQKEVIVKQGSIQLNGYVSSDKKTFSMNRSEIIQVLQNDSVNLESGMKISVKADIFAEEPNNSIADRTVVPGSLIY
jgi:hypothetical protein